MTVLSRVFFNGNSQAVRIPQEFRLDANRVQISRASNGDLIIHPIPKARGTALFEALNYFEPDFIAALEKGQEDIVEMQDRESF